MITAATQSFLAHRNLLFTVAYEMLGSAADAEDTGDLQCLLDILARTSFFWATVAGSSGRSFGPSWAPTRWRAFGPLVSEGSRPRRCGRRTSTAIRR